jgi:hypothetical protein
MHDMLSRDAMMLGIAYRMTGREIYAQHAAEIVKMYADKVQGFSDRRQLREAIEYRRKDLFADIERVHLADRHDVCV